MRTFRTNGNNPSATSLSNLANKVEVRYEARLTLRPQLIVHGAGVSQETLVAGEALRDEDGLGIGLEEVANLFVEALKHALKMNLECSLI